MEAVGVFLDEGEIARRVDEFADIAEEVMAQRAADRVGETVEVLVEEEPRGFNVQLGGASYQVETVRGGRRGRAEQSDSFVDGRWMLRAPLTGIRQASGRLGVPPPDITVGMRTGDTPADERRNFARTPPDILITTPESLYLLLTSAARDSLRGVETVIIDEVHAAALARIK